MAASMILIAVFGILCRIIIIRSPVSCILSERVELVTPVTSWKTITEGIFLLENGIPPYSGDNIHEAPLVLYFFSVINELSPTLIPLVFVILDLVTAFILYKASRCVLRYLLNQQILDHRNYSKDVDGILIMRSDLTDIPNLVLMIYLLNPFSILTCTAQSTIVLTNLFVAATFLFMLKGRWLPCSLTLALASYQSLYPVMLIVPCALHIAQLEMQQQKLSVSYSSRTSLLAISKFVIAVFIWAGVFLFTSFIMVQSWDFIYSTYGCVLTVPNLQPNMGLFWYFFLEMFDHFRLFFLCVFQLNAFIYTLPLSMAFWRNPCFVFYCLIALTAVFKSYPAFGDACIYLALLPVWSHSYRYFRNGLVVGVMLILASVLAPVLWHLWIYAGSANANFFFAFTLIYNTAQIFLITDVIFAKMRRDFHLKHGLRPLDDQGNEKLIQLQ